MRRSAFTLMELLTVITIIIILMGMLFPVISMVRTHMKKVKTVSILGQLDAACSSYKSICGAYPDADAIGAILMPSPPTPVTADSMTDGSWQGVSSVLLALLQVVDRDDFSTTRYPSGYIADSWNNVVRYRTVRYYPYLQTPHQYNNAPIAIDAQSQPPPHQDSYQAWSKGANEVDDYGTNDDITNWQQ